MFSILEAALTKKQKLGKNTNRRLVSAVVMGDVSPTSLVRLFFTLENVAMPVLAIPKDDFKRYSFYPLKWLRFLGYAIYGFEGDLSETEEGDTVDYSSADLKDSYYFVSNCTCSVFLFKFQFKTIRDRRTKPCRCSILSERNIFGVGPERDLPESRRRTG